MNVKANGITMNYALEGPAGAPVVTLSHSLAARLEMWEPQVRALTGRWRVLRYDTRGHGGSDAPSGAYTLDLDRKSTRLNSSHITISYAVFCLKKKKKINNSYKYTKTSNINHIT